MTDPPQHSKLRVFKNWLGWYDTTFIPLGTIVILSVSGLLGSFWEWGNRNDISNVNRVGFWSTVVIQGWGNRVITLSTAAIRVCMASQILVCCYMLASMAMEYDHILEKDREEMAIYQRGNDGPYSILLLYIKALWRKQRSNTLGLLVLALLLVISFASQLFSTTLLSDLAAEILPGTAVVRQIPYDTRTHEDYTAYNTRPREFPIFGESKVVRTFVDGNGSTPGFFDSGPVNRVFVPLVTAERESLASYDGPVNALEMQYLCLPLPLNYTWNDTLMTGTLGQPSPQLKQIIADHGARYNLTANTQWSQITFACDDPWRGEITICDVGSSITQNWKLLFGTASNTTSPESPSGYQGEWLTKRFYRSNALTPNVRMKYTACFNHLSWGDGYGRLTSSGNLTEPVLLNSTAIKNPNTWDIGWNTSSIQRVLGVQFLQPLPVPQRGIYELLSYNITTPGLTAFYGSGLSYVPNWNWCIGPHSSAVFFTADGRPSCMIKTQLNRALFDVFNNTFTETGRVGLAHEAVTSVLHADSYYQELPRFNSVAEGTVRAFVNGEAPRRWVGFAVVMAFVGTHLGIVAVLLVVYARSKSFGRAWKVEEGVEKMGSREELVEKGTVGVAVER
ncbi:hypothetical protein K440DRAFT_663841 [Wilcoxina mikolae CBS 423.85]|nr:hypothetical protein K440DRAFT_663841 [Wilcoxina mikolae CBS 423.85]